MTENELLDKLNEIQLYKCETNVLEIKAARLGCPTKLYDTLSSFSNQDDGGVIVFGVDEDDDFCECGVYDSQDIQKKVNEQCLQMEPVVRPLMTVVEKDGKKFVSAEIPGVDIADRPCYYKGKGRLKGSHIRVGDSDEPMTEYEVYSYEAFRKKYQDDIREIQRATLQVLNKEKLDQYILKLKDEKPNLASLPDESIYELMSITREGGVTLSTVLLFCEYPQVFFPQLSIIATRVPGDRVGDLGESGERFIDNERIEGNIMTMLERVLAFVKKNMSTMTIVNPVTGQREDRTEYPMLAIREAVLNTLVHRDYSIHTEGMPIQVTMYDNRIEIKNPGGLYGRIGVNQLGKVQADTRNPVLATALEVLGVTENRYSGIPTIQRAMRECGLEPPVFDDSRGSFSVILYNGTKKSFETGDEDAYKEKELLQFLKIPRSRREIAEFLGINTVTYAMQTYIAPLIESDKVRMTDPDNPRSHRQKYVIKEV